MDSKTVDNVNVAIRVRPSNNILEGSIGIKLLSEDPPVLFAVDRQQTFCFDNIFSHDVSQQELYEQMVKPLVHKVLEGYNCTVFAYGQTGTGKTYTIGSEPETYNEDAGFILRTLDEVFGNKEDVEVSVSISFFEIYNEKVYDLLNNSKKTLAVKGFKIEGLTQTKVNSSDEACNLLKVGSRNRHKGATKQNSNSSRSHAIFTIHCNVKHEDTVKEAKLYLVDLAGCESARKTGNEGSQLQEGISINKGLFHLGRVIKTLSTNPSNLVPYRGSILTTILSDSCNVRNYVTLVACISPDSQDIYETLQTLEFALQAQKVRNRPEVNNIVQQYKKENPELFERPLLGSAVKARPTPLKRQNYHSMECVGTPSMVKKPKFVNNTWTPMNTIAERQQLIANVSTPPSLFSMSVSTVNDVTSMLPPLSPIVRKCTEAIENTMMEKLQMFMKAHLQRPTPDKRDTPQFFKRLESTVTQIVRSEIIQLTSQRSRACSSPVHDLDTTYVSGHFGGQETILSSSSVVAKRLEFEDDPLSSETTAVFKMPIAPPRKAIKRKSPSESETEDKIDEPSTSTGRRSTRLSLKKSENTEPVARRRSVRLSMQKQEAPVEKVETPKPRPRKRTKVAEEQNDGSPMTNHNKYILNILNTGEQKDLQKLPLIGPKTAAQIYFYRQLNGQFASISDLGKMEWRGKGFERFLKANFIKIEDEDDE